MGVSRSQSSSIIINLLCMDQSSSRSTRGLVLCELDDCDACEVVSYVGVL